MKLTIDNLQGAGAQDYTAALDATVAPRVVRKINKAATLQMHSAGELVELCGAGDRGAGDFGESEWELCVYGIFDAGSAVRIFGVGAAGAGVSLLAGGGER